MRDFCWAARRADSANIPVSPRKRCSPCAPASRFISSALSAAVRKPSSKHSAETSPQHSRWITRQPKTCPRAAIELYNSQLPPGGEPIDYKALTAEFEGFGIAGLNNGLDAAENERLLTTMNLPEMIALVLRGLGRLGKPPVLPS